MQRIRELDGLRGLAVVLVVVWHYYVFLAGRTDDLGAAHEVLRGVATLGWSGVDLFFVLSGYLIGGLLLDHRHATNLFRVFYARRSCRIFPLYYLLVVVVFAGMLARPQPGSFWHFLWQHETPLWAYVVHIQNFFMAWRGRFDFEFLNVSWSLAIEEQFYLILPVLVWAVPRRTLVGVAVAVVALAPLARLAAHHALNEHAAYVLPFGRLDGLFIGVLLAVARRTPAAAQWIRQHTHGVWAVAGLSGLALVGLVMHRLPEVVLPWTYPGTYVLVNTFWGAVMTLVAFELSPRLMQLCRTRMLVGLGLVSYGIYLLHKPVFLLLANACAAQLTPGGWLGPWRFAALAVAATTLASWVSWRWFERPLVTLGHRLRYRDP